MTEPKPKDEGVGDFYINFPKASPLDQLMVCDVCHDKKATHRMVYRSVILEEAPEVETRFGVDALVCKRCAQIVFNCFNHMKAAMRRDGIEVTDES